MQTTRSWLPVYADPKSYLPAIQETAVLFSEPPYLMQDFIGKGITFLRSEAVRKMGFEYDPARALPCKWKCSDESVFGVDLCLYAYSGRYPFSKGKIGGGFNEISVRAAAHHSPMNVDLGGSHVGYIPGPGGGKFGHVIRPLQDGDSSTDCGYLMSVTEPFKQIYDDACRNIQLFCPEGDRVIVSIPNEYLQPSWSSQPIKLLVDIETLTVGYVPYEAAKVHTHRLAGRSLFFVDQRFLDALPADRVATYRSADPTPIGSDLTARFFNIFDSSARMSDEVPEERLLPYMKHILSSKVAPFPLQAAIANANLEHNTLVDCVRAEEFRPYAFASFTGVFIDIFDNDLGAYVNLFVPIGISLKPAGRCREIEIAPEEIHALFGPLKPARPALPLEGVLGYKRPDHILSKFTFTPA